MVEVQIDKIVSALQNAKQPQSEFVKDILPVNKYGYIESNDCATNIPGIFVAGDCREKNVRQLATAINDGAIAATIAIDYLKNR